MGRGHSYSHLYPNPPPKVQLWPDSAPPAILQARDYTAGLKDGWMTLTPDAGLAVQPSSAVAVLVSIKVSVGQKRKSGESGRLLDGSPYGDNKVTYDYKCQC